MEAVVKVIKHFGRIPGTSDNVIVIYIRTTENFNNLKQMVDKKVIINEKPRWIKYTRS